MLTYLVPQCNALRAHGNGLHAGGAHFVDRGAIHTLRQAYACPPNGTGMFMQKSRHPICSPPNKTAWRVGDCPAPAETTLPKIASPTSSGLTPARATAAFTTAAPNFGAVNEDNAPPMEPMGVRTAQTITTSCADVEACGAVNVSTRFAVREHGGEFGWDTYTTTHARSADNRVNHCRFHSLRGRISGGTLAGET
jgi:hypothetical protein